MASPSISTPRGLFSPTLSDCGLSPMDSESSESSSDEEQLKAPLHCIKGLVASGEFKHYFGDLTPPRVLCAQNSQWLDKKCVECNGSYTMLARDATPEYWICHHDIRPSFWTCLEIQACSRDNKVPFHCGTKVFGGKDCCQWCGRADTCPKCMIKVRHETVVNGKPTGTRYLGCYRIAFKCRSCCIRDKEVLSPQQVRPPCISCF